MTSPIMRVVDVPRGAWFECVWPRFTQNGKRYFVASHTSAVYRVVGPSRPIHHPEQVRCVDQCGNVFWIHWKNDCRVLDVAMLGV